MMFKTHFGETVTVVLALVMGLIMAFGCIAVDGLELNYANVFKIWAMITLVILIVSILIPYKKWSARIVGKLPVKQGGVAYKMLDNLLPSVILNTCNTVLVSAAMILFNEAVPESQRMHEWIAGILHDWPIMFVLSYFAAFIAEAIGIWIAKKTVKDSIS